ncbi:MAG: macro domain-containing protein [Longimicrobiales bacterium]|nr:macro domain-containing protein [Longimicrobiales bacterium]
MIRIVRGRVTEVKAEALLREARPDGGPLTPSGRIFFEALGPEGAHLLQLHDAPPGSAWITPAGSLSASFLIHLVVQSGDEPVTVESVRRALTNGLRRAAAFGIESVALTPLGIGAGNLDAETSAEVMVTVLVAHLEHDAAPRVFELVVGTEYEEDIFRRAAERHASPNRPS